MQDIERIKADLDVLIAHPPKEIDAKKFAELVERTRKAISAKNYHELKRFVSLYISKIIVRNDDITVVVSYSKIVLLVGGAEGNRFEKVSIPSSRDRAAVHRTVAFGSFDSPQINTIPNKEATP